MRAVRFSSLGGPEVLDLVEVELPDPGPGQVRVRLVTAGVNPADLKRFAGVYRGGATAIALPAGVGRELAGVVEAVGAGVDALAVGDAVFGTVPDGALADAVVADAAQFAVKPAGLLWPVAGALALVGQTAWDEIASQRVRAGETALVSAAAGGVGVVACQLLLAAGLRVIGTASPANHDFLAALGVEPVGYGDGLVDRVRRLAPAGVDVVFDHAGQETIRAGLELGVAPTRINTTATDPTPFGVVWVGRGPRNPALLAHLADLVVTGALQLPIADAYRLADVRAAYAHLAGGHVRGKIVIDEQLPA